MHVACGTLKVAGAIAGDMTALLMHCLCCRIIATSFNNDKTFQNVLNHSFESFINLSQRSPEFISLFMDDKLRKGLKGMTDNDIESVLDKVMMLFRYLQEKDVFEKYYKQHLAKRLLSGRTVSSFSLVIAYMPSAALTLMHCAMQCISCLHRQTLPLLSASTISCHSSNVCFHLLLKGYANVLWFCSAANQACQLPLAKQFGPL